MSNLSIFQQLLQALLLLSVLVIFIILLITIYMRMNKRTFLWKPFIRTYWLYLALWLYYLLVLCITCFSRGEIQSVNLRLFASYENAWFGGSINAWQQLLLNIAMFIPIGMMLVGIQPRMKRWYISGVICFLGSLCIESIQYVFHLGVFEIDDLFNNTLGGLLGYSMIMLILKLKTKQFVKAWRYGILPFVMVGMSVLALICYQTQAYGNLATDSFFCYDWGDTEVTYEGKLSKKQDDVGMYELKQVTSKQVDELRIDLQHKLNLSEPLEETNLEVTSIYQYDNGQLTFDKQSGTWQYDRHTGQARMNAKAMSGNQEKALKIGEELGLLDEFAKVVQEGEGNTTIWRWELDGLHDGRCGYLMIDCDDAGEVLSIQYDAIPYRFIRQAAIISQADAYQKLQDGHFRPWRTVDFKKITFKEVKLDYVLDTKNYLQPVYRFYGEGKKGGQEIIISALAN